MAERFSTVGQHIDDSLGIQIYIFELLVVLFFRFIVLLVLVLRLIVTLDS